MEEVVGRNGGAATVVVPKGEAAMVATERMSAPFDEPKATTDSHCGDCGD